MRINRITFLFQTLTLTLLTVCARAGDITAFYLASQPGSWVGQGETVLITSDDPFTISGGVIPGGYGAFFQIDNYQFLPFGDPGNRWWGLDFQAPYGQQLQVGSYPNAWRPVTRPNESRDIPGLDVFGNACGYNTLLGEFEILELTLTSEGQLQAFAANFEVFDGYDLHGAIRYHSAIPVPEPSALFLSSASLLLIATLRRLRSNA